MTCDACGHVFVPTTLSFTIEGDDALSFALPAGEATCPRCGAPVD